MPAGAPNLVGLTQYDNQTSFFGDGSNVLLTEVGMCIVFRSCLLVLIYTSLIH